MLTKTQNRSTKCAFHKFYAVANIAFISYRSSAGYDDFGTATLSSVTNVGTLSTAQYDEDPNNRVTVRMLYKLRGEDPSAYFNDTYAYMSLALTDNQKWVGVMPVVDNGTIVYDVVS